MVGGSAVKSKNGGAVQVGRGAAGVGEGGAGVQVGSTGVAVGVMSFTPCVAVGVKVATLAAAA
jgi:hypothetical protein